MFCHGELARLKPDPSHLTTVLFNVRCGWRRGAAFVALLAPRFSPDITNSRWRSGTLRDSGLSGALPRCRRAIFAALLATVMARLLVALVIAVVASLFSDRPEQARGFAALRPKFLWRASGSGRQSSQRDRRKGRRRRAAGRRCALPPIDERHDRSWPAIFGVEPPRWPTTYYGPNSGIGVALRVGR